MKQTHFLALSLRFCFFSLLLACSPSPNCTISSRDVQYVSSQARAAVGSLSLSTLYNNTPRALILSTTHTQITYVISTTIFLPITLRQQPRNHIVRPLGVERRVVRRLPHGPHAQFPVLAFATAVPFRDRAVVFLGVLNKGMSDALCVGCVG